MPVTVYTVGHSNRTLEALLGILRAHGIECLADVRTVPRSRHNPQFNAETLAKSLAGASLSDALLCRGIATIHLLDARKAVEHRLTSFAKIQDGRPAYPAEQASLPGARPGKGGRGGPGEEE